MKKAKRTYNHYEEEARQFTDAARVRRGKDRNGYPPSFFADVFAYEQPRRNHRGCGDVHIVQTLTGESEKVHCDDVSVKFQHRRAPSAGKFALRTDRRDLADQR